MARREDRRSFLEEGHELIGKCIFGWLEDNNHEVSYALVVDYHEESDNGKGLHVLFNPESRRFFSTNIRQRRYALLCSQPSTIWRSDNMLRRGIRLVVYTNPSSDHTVFLDKREVNLVRQDSPTVWNVVEVKTEEPRVYNFSGFNFMDIWNINNTTLMSWTSSGNGINPAKRTVESIIVV